MKEPQSVLIWSVFDTSGDECGTGANHTLGGALEAIEEAYFLGRYDDEGQHYPDDVKEWQEIVRVLSKVGPGPSGEKRADDGAAIYRLRMVQLGA